MSLQGIIDALAANVNDLLERVDKLEVEVASLRKVSASKSSSSTQSTASTSAAKKTASSSS